MDINRSIQFSCNLGDNIIIAFSGGADSLLCALIAKQYFKKVYLVFLYDHCINSLDIIKLMARNLNLELIIKISKKAYYNDNHQRARNELIDILTVTALEHNIKCVWLGHNLDDLLGTFQMRLESKSSDWGLASISSITLINTIYFIRPILYMQANDIRESIQIQYFNHPGNYLYDKRNYRNSIKLNWNYLDQIYYLQEQRKNIQEYIEMWCKDNIVKYSTGYISVNKNILDLPTVLMNRIIGYLSNYCYPNMYTDFANKIYCMKNFTAAGCLFKYSKNHIYIFREYLNQDFSKFDNWCFDRRWYTNYKSFTKCKCINSNYANLTIPTYGDCNHFKYLLPSFICYY